MPTTCGIENREIRGTPIAVIDLETTGLAPGRDRVVELSVVRRDPGREPVLALDTLVNPSRRVAATEIHGITDEDVEDAPRFESIAANVVEALSDCVVAAYNVYFDIRFLAYELERCGVKCPPPHFCTSGRCLAWGNCANSTMPAENMESPTRTPMLPRETLLPHHSFSGATWT